MVAVIFQHSEKSPYAKIEECGYWCLQIQEFLIIGIFGKFLYKYFIKIPVEAALNCIFAAKKVNILLDTFTLMIFFPYAKIQSYVLFSQIKRAMFSQKINRKERKS